MRSLIAIAHRGACATLLASVAAAGCARNTVTGSCGGARVQAVAAQATPFAGELSGLKSGLGGYIVFGGKRCSALFRFEVKDGKASGVAFTGRHCGRDSPGADDGAEVTLDLFTPDGYIKAVPVAEEFSVRRAAYLSKAKALEAASPEAARILKNLATTTRFPSKSVCSLASDASAYFDAAYPMEEQSSTYQSALKAQQALAANKDTHVASCWMYAEVGVYPFELDTRHFEKPEFAGLKELVEKDEAHRADLVKAASTATTTSATAETRALWERDALVMTGQSRVISHAAGIDFLRWCKTDDGLKEATFSGLALGGVDFAAAKKACEVRAQVKDALAPYLKERIWSADSGGFAVVDVFQMASSKGYSDEDPLVSQVTGTTSTQGALPRYFSSDSSVQGIYNTLFTEQRARFEKLIAAWKLGLGIPGVGVNIVVSGATAGAPGSVRFSVVPLTSFHPEKTSFVIDKTPLYNHAFRLFLKKEGARLALSPGDSGALLTLDGYLPIASLNGVGDDVTSAGASVIALPSRRSRNYDSPSAPSSAERQEPKKTEDGGGAKTDCG